MQGLTSRLLLLFLVLLLGGCSSMNPMNWWADEDNAEQPAELEEITNQLSIQTLWSTGVGSGLDEQRVRLLPYLSEGRLYVANRDGVIKALNAETGQQLWSVDTELELSGGPGAGDGLVLIGTSEADVVALDAASGQELWRGKASSEVLSVPQVTNGVVVVRSIDGKVYGLNAGTGERLWHYERSIPGLTLQGDSSPVIANNLVVVGYAGGRLVALDLLTGGLVWDASISAPSGRSELERMVDIDGDPIIVDGIVYVSTYQGDLAAVSLETGVVIWRHELSSYNSVSVEQNQLYLTDASAHIWAFETDSGSALWKNKKLHARRLSPPAIIDEYLVVGDFEGYLHWISRDDGQILARSRVGSAPISAAPQVKDGIVYIYGDGGKLAALSTPSRL
ncbi:MAG: outer membrane protein assembly factor BamB [Gammaproteobacteria bacterium]|nr:outer membrane protein assembly factor BamB [Gammaproteobacteria bacterium]